MKIQAERIPFGETHRTVARGDHTHAGLGAGILKSEDEARNSTTTLSTDSELFKTLEAGKKYLVRGIIFFDAANAAMDLKYDLQYSGLATQIGARICRHIAPGTTTETIVVPT